MKSIEEQIADAARPIWGLKFDVRGGFTDYDRQLETSVRGALVNLKKRSDFRWWNNFIRIRPLAGKWDIRSFVARNPYHELSREVLSEVERVFRGRE